MRIKELTKQSRSSLLKELLKRSPEQYEEYEKTVKDILNDVRSNGDEAVIRYTNRFDKNNITADTLRVTEEEIEKAYASYDKELIRVMEKAAENIRSYHERQLQNSWFESSSEGIILGQKITPLSTVGVYVPGGKAAYPSSTLMCIIPALTAGVERIIMTTPSDSEGRVSDATLVAARITGVKEIYKVGG
ncbi:MAG: histidinol dehydrogenase, partial [Lachnospiraceae bacterium]|nr:histidinol dehydrogenase [Lachnospiraceae bacterium]